MVLQKSTAGDSNAQQGLLTTYVLGDSWPEGITSEREQSSVAWERKMSLVLLITMNPEYRGM